MLLNNGTVLPALILCFSIVITKNFGYANWLHYWKLEGNPRSLSTCRFAHFSQHHHNIKDQSPLPSSK